MIEFIISLLRSPAIGVFTKATDYLAKIEYHDGTNWQPLSSKIVF